MGKFKKCKLLLDEGLPPRSYLPRTNAVHTLKHIVSDFHKPGLNDKDVYALAKKHKVILVVYNSKHFIKLIKDDEVGVIGVSMKWTYEQIDKKLLSCLAKMSLNQLRGKFYSLSRDK